MKLHHLLVLAILGGFVAFALAVGCSNENPVGSQLTQGAGELATDDDVGITTVKKKKTKKKATRVFKKRAKRKTALVERGRGIGHLAYRTGQDGPPFTYGVIVQDLKGVTRVTLEIGEFGEPGWRIAYLYLSEDQYGVDAGPLTGMRISGEITEEELYKQELTPEDLAEYLMMNQVFMEVATRDHPDGAIGGQLREVDETPLRVKKRAKKK